MTKLKLEDVAEAKPVKVTIELSADIHDELTSYAAVLSQGQGNVIIKPQQLIGPMIARFMLTDRDFAKAKKQT